jgi:two-component system, OmpR family, response regulator
VRVLVVEDVATVAARIAAALRTEGMEVAIAATGAEAEALRASFRPDMVLLDLSLPDVSGLELVGGFTGQGAGVIVVTASAEEEARVTALDTGADDYMIKPVLANELSARIRAVHRRLQGRARPVGSLKIVVDSGQRTVTSPDGRNVALTEAEMLTMEALLTANATPVSREDLSVLALRRKLHDEDRSVDQLVMKLRRKLGEIGCGERVILSVRRQGYVISTPSLFQVGSDEAMA